MADRAHTQMTVEEFFEWCRGQDQRFELVDGYPVALRTMAGASIVHDAIATNIIAALRGQLRGTGCRPTTPDAGLRTAIKRIRRPDVTVECAPPVADTYEVRNPIAVFEILSPTTRKNDRSEKLPEYMRHPSLRVIVHVDPDLMDVLVYRRAADGGWDAERLVAPTASVTIAGTPIVLTLATIYEDAPLPEAPAASEQA